MSLASKPNRSAPQHVHCPEAQARVTLPRSKESP
ncbi:MAG: hypothetical protein RL685_6717 [Pseudomonadota bacterium]|jgi:hypothetical protein